MSAAAAFHPLAALAGRGAPPRGAAMSGALLAPDFDAPPAIGIRPDPAAEAAAALEARLAAARAEGFAEGESAGRVAASAAARGAREAAEAAALAAIADALAGADAAARDAVAEAADALGRLLAAALGAALLAEAVRPILEHAGAVTLFVAPGMAAAAAARIAGAPVGCGISVEEDAALAPGDARAAWRGGGAAAVLEERQRAVAAVLAALGLAEGEAA